VCSSDLLSFEGLDQDSVRQRLNIHNILPFSELC
jgi:hypothetical protein